jgi:hypothetical protein
VIVGVAALAANQRVVFLAKHTLTDAEFDGSSHRISDLPLEAFYIAVVRVPAQTAFGG